MSKVVFFSQHKFELKTLRQHFEPLGAVSFIETALNEDTAILAKGANAISIFVNDNASAPVLEKLASYGIRLILLRCAGYNNVDLDAAKKLGIQVCNVPEYSPHAVAEHTLALILALNRKIIRAYYRVFENNYSLDGLTGFDMHGKTVGVIGVGKIGKCVAKILIGFGCHVLAYDPNQDQELVELNVEYVSLEKIYAASDIITLHSPLLPTTKHMINHESIQEMKDGVMLINTSRGGLIKTIDVIKNLKSGKIGYLGLDVYEEESGLFFEDHSEDILQDDVIARLKSFRNVLITSHQAFLTTTALDNIAETSAYNYQCFLSETKSKHALIS